VTAGWQAIEAEILGYLGICLKNLRLLQNENGTGFVTWQGSI